MYTYHFTNNANLSLYTCLLLTYFYNKINNFRKLRKIRRKLKQKKNGIRAIDEEKYKKKHGSKKLRKIRRILNKLYLEYKQLNISKTDNDKLDQLIDNISKIEYKYIQYLKIQ